VIDDLWYKNGVIYCLSVGTYMDANGDGVGDFRGLLRRLDYLHGLGITAIWLMPFQPSPMRDDGYDIADYYGVDPRYGTLGDFVEFTHGCKQRGIRVIIDLVVNHTSDQHPWFKEARKQKDSPYRDWYVWSEKKPANADTGMVFPGVQKSTWSRDKEAGAWYFHRFYDFQPDLNTSNPHVQAEILKIMGFWIQLGVSGFRMDAVPFVIATKGPKVRKPVEQYDMLRSFREFLQWRKGDAIILAEANVLRETDMDYFGRDGDRMHMMFNFHVNQHLFYALASADSRPLAKSLAATRPRPATAQWGLFLRNHDELDLGRLAKAQRDAVFKAFGAEKCMQLYDRGIRRRLAPMLGGDRRRLELAYSLMCTLPGTPVIRYGDELAMGDNLDRAHLRPHADAMVDRAACRLHRERQALRARDRPGPLRLRAHQRRQAASRSEFNAELDRAHHPHAQGGPGSRLGRLQGDRDTRSGRVRDPLRLAQQLGAVRAQSRRQAARGQF
jgi:maltose alpha-D-glucosyltransferase/alpha-amylase